MATQGNTKDRKSVVFPCVHKGTQKIGRASCSLVLLTREHKKKQYQIYKKERYQLNQ